MEKIAILTDTGSDLTKKIRDEYGIYVMSFYINIDGKYEKEAEIKSDEFYERMKNASKLPKTSIPSPGELIEKLDQIKNDGFEKVIIITISDRLSSFNNMCHTINYDKMDIRVINSKNIALGSGMLSIYAKTLVDEGYDFESIVEKIEQKKHQSEVFFFIDTLKYLKAGGRIGRVQASLGEVLSIKPIISCDTNDGVYYVLKKTRGENKALNYLIDFIKDKLKDSREYFMAICHGNNHKSYEKVKEALDEEIKGSKLFFAQQIAPTLAANTGAGLVGVAILKLN